jgi:hypothetical protein
MEQLNMKRLKDFVSFGLAGLGMAWGVVGCQSAPEKPPTVSSVAASSTVSANPPASPAAATNPIVSATTTLDAGSVAVPTNGATAATTTPAPIHDNSLAPSTTPTAIATAEKSNDPKSPSQMVFNIDLTGSSDENRVVTPTIEQVGDGAEIVKRSGGDFRVAVTCSKSDTSMLGVSFAEPEAELPPLEAPPDEKKINPLKRPDARLQYQAKQAQYAQQQQKHQQREAARNTANDLKLKQFLVKVQPLLKLRGTCNSTDIVGMTKRANLFFNEPYPTKGQPARRVALLVTDGLETVRKHPEMVKFADGTEVIIVCGGGETGILTGQQFESLDSAIRYLSNNY